MKIFPEAVEVAIVGGGPVGATLALALADRGLEVALFEAKPTYPSVLGDPRALALSEGTRQILTWLDVWPKITPATPITQVHVSQQGGFGQTHLPATDVQQTALGYVVNYDTLAHALQQQVLTQNVPVYTHARVEQLTSLTHFAHLKMATPQGEQQVLAQQIVVADGGALLQHLAVGQREKDYGQTALLTEISLAKAHNGMAYERFTTDGALALLPFGEKYAVVWTVPTARAHTLLAASESEFLAALQASFGLRAGEFLQATPRAAYPLRARYSLPHRHSRIVCVGNAAQTLHPVAGQGFNLGIRDAWCLADILANTPKTQLGTPTMMADYRHQRRLDVTGTLGFTDSLLQIFAQPNPLIRSLRGMGLHALDNLPPAKRFVMRRLMQGARG